MIADYLAQSANAANPQPISQPLTGELMDGINEFNNRADEIISRLFGVRDRLFGSNTAGDGKATAIPPAPMNFSDAYLGKAGDLRSKLITLDQLSCEFNNRL